MLNFYGDGCLLVAHAACQTGNPTDDGAVTCVDDHTSGYTWRREENPFLCHVNEDIPLSVFQHMKVEEFKTEMLNIQIKDKSNYIGQAM